MVDPSLAATKVLDEHGMSSGSISAFHKALAAYLTSGGFDSVLLATQNWALRNGWTAMGELAYLLRQDIQAVGSEHPALCRAAAGLEETS